MGTSRYKRVIVKISGEALKGEGGYGIDVQTLRYVASRTKEGLELGVQIGLVIGGG
ncbi:MAG: UMP kinase, partial [Chloroflexi bacterium]|nr:UMP kinase [Chloroflexota bacterium]